MKAQVQKSKDEAEAILKIISKEKKVAEKKLKAAEPALQAAEAALQVEPNNTVESTGFSR